MHAPVGEVDERRLAVDAAASFAPGRDDRLRRRRARSPSPPPPSVPSATEPEIAARSPGRSRTSRDAALRLPLRGVVAETHARPLVSSATPAAPASLMRRTSRPVVEVEHRDLAAAAWTSTARVAVTTSVDRRAGQRALARAAASSRRRSSRSRPCARRRPWCRRARPRARAACRRIRMLPAPSRRVEVDHRDRRAGGDERAASRPAPPRRRACARAAARRPVTGWCACRAGRRSCVLVATTTTRAWAAAGTSSRSVRPARSVRTKRNNTADYVQSRSL